MLALTSLSWRNNNIHTTQLSEVPRGAPAFSRSSGIGDRSTAVETYRWSAWKHLAKKVLSNPQGLWIKIHVDQDVFVAHPTDKFESKSPSNSRKVSTRRLVAPLSLLPAQLHLESDPFDLNRTQSNLEFALLWSGFLPRIFVPFDYWF